MAKPREQVATLADLRVRGKGKKRRAAVGWLGLVTRQRSIIRRQRCICHGRGTCMCHRTKFARGDGVQPTRCSCRSMPRPMRARNTRRCPHDAHKDLAALEIVCTPRCCDCLLKGEAQSHPQSGEPGTPLCARCLLTGFILIVQWEETAFIHRLRRVCGYRGNALLLWLSGSDAELVVCRLCGSRQSSRW